MSIDEQKQTGLNQNAIERNTANHIKTFFCPHSGAVEADVEPKVQQTLRHLPRSRKRVHAPAQLMIRVHFLEYFQEIIVAIPAMEEEGEIQRGHQLKLLSEVLVLSLREKRPSLSHLLVAKVETIIVQTKLSNRHDLLFGLPFLPNGDQLLHHLLGISLQEFGTACRVNANGGVEAVIRASQR